MFEFLIDDKFVSKEDRIAVGVSGGADSMLLLWGLIDKQKQVGFYFEVINVNHHLRGKASDEDSKFVEDFCKKRKIDYKIIDVDVKKLKNDQKFTLEESARVARFDAFKDIMKKDKLNKLFLAHHKNDQAETILMHIFRGSGLSGAVGIKNTETIFRPLLNLTKDEILNLAKEHGISYVQDESNADNDYSRNFIRNVVLPQIETVYPKATENIALFGKRCEEVLNYVLSLIDESLIEEKKNEVILKESIFEQKMFLVREYLKKAFEKLGVFSDIESKHISMIFELCKGEVNKELSLPHGIVAKKTYGGVKLLKPSSKKEKQTEYEFVKNGEIIFENNFKIITKVVSPDEVVYGEGLFVDVNKISTNAIWRTRKIGDRFSKIGTGSKKFNDYLTNNKVDFELRDKLPILAVENNVLVVFGDDVSENVKIDSTTDEIVKITFESLWFSWQEIYNLTIITLGEKLMFGKGFSIFKLLGMAVGLVVVLFLVFKASITGSIV